MTGKLPPSVSHSLSNSLLNITPGAPPDTATGLTPCPRRHGVGPQEEEPQEEEPQEEEPQEEEPQEEEPQEEEQQVHVHEPGYGCLLSLILKPHADTKVWLDL